MFGWNPCDRMFYYPSRKIYNDPAESGLCFESVWFDTSDGLRLHGLFFPAASHARGTVLHFHGNAGNVTGHFPLAAWMAEEGWNVFCFDYREFGQSEGRVSHDGTILDGHAALDHLLRRADVDPRRIVAFGQSLGGSVAARVGADRSELRGFILDGAFSGYRRIAWTHVVRNPFLLAVGWWAPWLLVSRTHDALDHIGRLAPRPVLIMHGRKDRTVPCRMAIDLYRSANKPKTLWLIPDLDHLESTESLAGAVRPRIIEFFARATDGDTAGNGTEPFDPANRNAL